MTVILFFVVVDVYDDSIVANPELVVFSSFESFEEVVWILFCGEDLLEDAFPNWFRLFFEECYRFLVDGQFVH